MYNYPFFSFPHLRRYPNQYIPRTPYIKPNIKKEEPNYLRKGRIPSWSKMNDKEKNNSEGNCYYSYEEIQEAIFTYFSKYVENSMNYYK